MAALSVCVDALTLATEKVGADTPVLLTTEVAAVTSVLLIAGDVSNRFVLVIVRIKPGSQFQE